MRLDSRFLTMFLAVSTAAVRVMAADAGEGAAATRPATTRAAAAADSQHEQDMAALREWHYHFKFVPDFRNVNARLAAWVKLHPDDAEAIFFRYRLDLYDRGSIPPAASQRLRHSADLGFGPAQAYLGHLLVVGKYLPRDEAAGRAFLAQAVARDDADGLYLTALLYAFGGGGFRRDPAEAERLLRRAMELGAVSPYRLLARVLADQHREQEALATTEAGLRAGDSWLAGDLARWNDEGRSRPRDYAAAFKLYQEAAGWNYDGAERRLGEMCRDGLGTDRDPAQAFAWFQRAADGGDAAAKYELARAYLAGEGTDMDVAQGMFQLERAADMAHADAEALLGRAYLEGLWVKRDTDRARRWFEQAAAHGSVEAKAYVRALGPAAPTTAPSSRPTQENPDAALTPNPLKL